MPVNDTTTNQGYQKPNIANQLSDDVGRLRSALDSIDTDMAARLAKAGGVMTGELGVTAGTAGAPSVYFTGDTNTGLYSPGADQVAISTGGAGRLFVASDGKVGIGTSSPGGALEVGAVSGNVTAGDLTVTTTSGVALVTVGRLSSTAADNTTFNIRNRIGTSVLYMNSGDGRLGVGTSSPSAVHRTTINGDGSAIVGGLSLRNNGTEVLTIGTVTATDAANCEIWNKANGYLRLATNNTERARLDSSGRLLVGTSTSTNNIRLAQNLAVVGAGTNIYPGMAITAYPGGAGGYAPIIDLNRSRGSTDGSMTSVAADDLLGRIHFRGSDGSSFVNAAFIDASVDGTPGANDMPGRLVFSTTADGASSPTEAMRINNQRELLIGTTTRTANGGVLQVSNGITFPATQSACSDANTLDDYEEGTWTPTISGLTGFDTPSGRYTKIGRVVSCTFWVNGTFNAAYTISNPVITSLPFTPASTQAVAGSAVVLRGDTYALIVNPTAMAGFGELRLVITDSGTNNPGRRFGGQFTFTV